MTKHEFCKKQVGRLGVFESSFPKTSAGLQELVDTLERNSRNDDHARRTVDRLLKDSQFCPIPAQIIAASGSEPAVLKIPMGCAECNGSGWRSVSRMRACTDGTRSRGKVVEVWGSERCHCERGRFLKHLYEQSEEYRKSKEATS